MNKILVTGATGEYGKTVVKFLLKKGVDNNLVYALVRDEEKADDLTSLGINIVFGDYHDYHSLLKGFSGIDQLLFVSSNEMKNRSGQHLHVVRAAKKTGIKHIIYTSQLHKTDREASPINFIMKSHLSTEIMITKSRNVTYTILRNGVYLDMLPVFLGEKVLENGIFLPAGEGKIAFTLRSEMAEVAANVLLNPEEHENKIYDICGDGVSFTEIATIISEIIGKEVSYTSPILYRYIETVIDSGMPKNIAKIVGGFAKAAQEGELEGENSKMEKLLGRKPVSVSEFLQKIYK